MVAVAMTTAVVARMTKVEWRKDGADGGGKTLVEEAVQNEKDGVTAELLVLRSVIDGNVGLDFGPVRQIDSFHIMLMLL